VLLWGDWVVLGVAAVLLIGWELVVEVVTILGVCCVVGWVLVVLGEIAALLVLSSGRVFINVCFGIEYIAW
jgi:hypothetical protein